MQVQILDLVETRTESNQNVIILFCKTNQGIFYQFNVINTPYYVYIAVGEEFVDSWIEPFCNQLVNVLKNKNSYCNATYCSCNSQKNKIYSSIIREPCGLSLSKPKEFIRDAKLVYRGGFEIYETQKSKFLRIECYRNQDANTIATLIHNNNNFNCGTVNEYQKGVWGVSKNSVDAFIDAKKISSFEWILVPNTSSMFIDFHDIQVIKDETMIEKEVPWKTFIFDIETISKKYRKQETEEALYPIGLISTAINGKLFSFMLKSPSCKEELYNNKEDEYEKGLNMIKKKEEEREQEEKNKTMEVYSDDEELEEDELEKRRLASYEKKQKELARKLKTDQKHIGHVEYFESEIDLLQAFKRYWFEQDPDFIMGYNSNAYDMKYLINRAKKLNIKGFALLSRLEQQPLYYRSEQNVTNQTGTRENIIIDCPGRVFIDLKLIAEKPESGIKLSNYRLKDVSEYFNIGGKDDVEYDQIYDYFYGTSFTRFLLLKYCVRDVDLCVQIESLMDIKNKFIAKSRVLRVRVVDAVDRGLNYVLTMKVRNKINGEYLLPYHPNKTIMRPCYKLIQGYSELFQNAVNKQKYDGAYVYPPIIGYHINPISTFDFSSLYPSIIIALNICHSTLVPTGSISKEMVNITTTGFWFLKSEVKQGILPLILKELLSDRKMVKKQISTLQSKINQEKRSATVEEFNLLRMWDAKQGELKICANSLYGQLGSLFSDFSMFCGAVSITQEGKSKILAIRDVLESREEFKSLGLRVDYGDTDSVMVEFQKVQDFDQVLKWSKRIETFINLESNIFPPPMKMEHEKTSIRTLFLAKKKYVMVLKNFETGELKLKKSGIGKRDLTLYNSTTLQRIFEMAMLENRSSQSIMNYFQKRCGRLLGHRLRDIKQLLNTAQISKPIEQYKEPLPRHIVAAKMLISEDYDMRAGDRLGYYLALTATSKKKKKQDMVVPELLFKNYYPNMSEYVNQMINTAKKTYFWFFPGSTKQEKLNMVDYAANNNLKVHYPLKSQPQQVVSGELEKYGFQREKHNDSKRNFSTPTITRPLKQRKMDEIFGILKN